MDIAIPIFDGGYGTRAVMHDEAMLAWVRGAHETSNWTTSVCTGEDVAQAIQLGIEYDPQPPFDSGSTDKASPEIIELVRSRSRAPR